MTLALMAHGSGSSASFVLRTFGRTLSAEGIDVLAVRDTTGDVERVSERLRVLAGRSTAPILGGVSLGAHAAVLAAAALQRSGHEVAGLFLVLPAWTGEPGKAAALTAASATDLSRRGRSAAAVATAVEESLRSMPAGWVRSELARTWPGLGPTLPDMLRATARSRGPRADELAALQAPAAVVTIRADPWHPQATAEHWCRLIRYASLVVLDATPTDPQAPPLAAALVQGWHAAQGRGSAPPSAGDIGGTSSAG